MADCLWEIDLCKLEHIIGFWAHMFDKAYFSLFGILLQGSVQSRASLLGNTQHGPLAILSTSENGLPGGRQVKTRPYCASCDSA
jgi:hypothetical protein